MTKPEPMSKEQMVRIVNAHFLNSSAATTSEMVLRFARAIEAARDTAWIALEDAKRPTWECKAGGLRPLTEEQYQAQPSNIQRHYTRLPRTYTQSEVDALVAQELSRIANEPPVNGNDLARLRVLMAAQAIRARTAAATREQRALEFVARHAGDERLSDGEARSLIRNHPAVVLAGAGRG